MVEPSDGISVLYVDDGPDLVDLSTTQVDQKSEQFEVVRATSADEGLRLLSEQPVDCIVSAYELPGTDGIEFLRTVRDEHPELPFILYTDKGSEIIASDAISAGVTDYLQKTTGGDQPRLLAERVKNSVARHRLEEVENRANTILEASPDPILVEVGREIVYANPAAASLAGANEASDLNGLDVTELVHPDDVDDVIEAIQAIESADRRLDRVSRKVKTLTGETLIVDITARRITWDGRTGHVIIVRDVTDHRDRDREIGRLREEFETVFETAQDAIFLFDVERRESGPEFRLRRLNRALEAISGLSTEEDRGKTPRELLGEDVGAEVAANFQRCIQAGEPIGYEEVLEMPGGTVHWETRLAPVTENGDVTQIVGVAREVSELKEREQTLEQLVYRIRDLIETSSKSETAQVAIDIVSDVIEAPLAGVHLVSDDGERLESAAAHDDVRDEFGVPPEYVRTADNPVHELVWDVFEAREPRYISDTENHGALADETPARSGVIYPLGDHGVLIITTIEPDAFDNTDRNFIGLLAQTLTAALDRVEREAVLLERNQQLEQLHEASRNLIQAESPETIANRLIDATNAILDFPITMVRYYDEAEGGLVPVAANDAVDEVFESRKTFNPSGASLNWTSFESGSPAIYDDINEHDTAVDSDTPVRSLMIIPIGDHGTLSAAHTEPNSFDEGDVFLTRLLVTTAELALSRIDYEAELIRQRDALDRQNERLNEFASTLSHDLRNPLSVATGRLELLEAESDSVHLEALGRALNRMDELVDDVLTLAQAGESLGATQAVEIANLVQGCWQTVETDSVRLEVETDAVIDADETRLRQLVENLIRNAVEHGGGVTTITIGDVANGFYFEDDGRGIPPDERDKVFRAGYSTREDGSGFGLNIVREIVEAHDWTITITEGTSGGARFEITGVERIRTDEAVD